MGMIAILAGDCLHGEGPGERRAGRPEEWEKERLVPDIDAVDRERLVVEQDPQVPAIGTKADSPRIACLGRRLALHPVSERLGGGHAGQDRGEPALRPDLKDGGEDRLARCVGLKEINAIGNGDREFDGHWRFAQVDVSAPAGQVPGLGVGQPAGRQQADPESQDRRDEVIAA